MRIKVWWIGTFLWFLALTGCAQATPEPVTFTMEMSEYAFSPATIEVQVGQTVTIEMINTGTLEHEIMFGRTVKRTNNRPNGFEQDAFETARVEPQLEEQIAEAAMEDDMHADEDMHMEDHEGFMVLLPKTGDRAILTFTPTEDMIGEWEMGCFEQDGVHYDAGMKGTLVVIP